MDTVASIDADRARAWSFLSAFLSLDAGSALQLTLQLRPRESDYARVFVGASASRVHAGYLPFWSAPVAPLPRAGQSNLIVTAALAAELGLGTTAARAFPGAYTQIASRLQPDRVWVAWKYTRPGEPYGMAWDGLVWMDDRWAWFPKPWRVLVDA